MKIKTITISIALLILACSITAIAAEDVSVAGHTFEVPKDYNIFNTSDDQVILEETLAVVRVLEESWGGRIDFTDVLLMLKMDGEWKAVAKAYNQNSETIQKE